LSAIKTSDIADPETRRIAEVGLGEGDKCADGSYEIQTTLIEVRGKDALEWNERKPNESERH